jgi:glyoxylase-like metal-dependent hydrolase (beta-lactamase superfamily II)
MRLVLPGIYAIDGLRQGRSYLLEGSDGLALIDTSSAGAAPGILAAIAAIGRVPEDLRLIIATHYHYDHTGNAATLMGRTGARLCAHTADAPYIDGRIPWMSMKGAFGGLADRMAARHFALRVERELREGDTLPFAGGLRVVHAPGHTPGNIALYGEQRGVLFAGDALMNVLGLRLPLAMSSHDMEEARRTVGRIAALDYDVALPGHGGPIIGRASEKISAWARTWVARP